MPLLAEELMDLTLDELINEYGAEFEVNEYWFGLEFSLNVQGLTLYAAPADYAMDGDTHLF